VWWWWCYLEAGGQGSPHNHHSVSDLSCQHAGNMLYPVGTVSYFSALILLVGWQEGHPACKGSATTIPKRLLLVTGLTWSDLTWDNSWKWVSETKAECVRVCVCVGASCVHCLVIEQSCHKPGKPGILRHFSEHGKLREFSGNSVQPQGKIVTNKVFLVRHSNICVKCGGDLLYCWSWCGMALDEGHYY